MAAPTIVPPGLPDRNDVAGQPVTVPFSGNFDDGEAPPTTRYVLNFDGATGSPAPEVHATIPVWTADDGATIVCKIVPTVMETGENRNILHNGDGPGKFRLQHVANNRLQFNYKTPGDVTETIQGPLVSAGTQYTITFTFTTASVVMNDGTQDYEGAAPDLATCKVGYFGTSNTPTDAFTYSGVLKDVYMTMGDNSDDRIYLINDNVNNGGEMTDTGGGGDHGTYVNVQSSNWSEEPV